MVSQRACLDFAIAETADMAGPVYELGLGNGRTFHHMRARISGRDIYVFERAIAAQPDSCPDPEFAYEGDINETLPLNKPISVALPALSPGDYPFHCQMQMYRGSLNVTEENTP